MRLKVKPRSTVLQKMPTNGQKPPDSIPKNRLITENTKKPLSFNELNSNQLNGKFRISGTMHPYICMVKDGIIKQVIALDTGLEGLTLYKAKEYYINRRVAADFIKEEKE